MDHLGELHHGGAQRAFPLQHVQRRRQVQPRQVGALRLGVLRGEVLQVDGGQPGGPEDTRARRHLPVRLHGEPVQGGVRPRPAQRAGGEGQRDPQDHAGVHGASHQQRLGDLGSAAALPAPHLRQEFKR